MRRSIPMAAALVALAATAATPACFAQASPARLQTVLQQMDTASREFHSATAEFRWDNYERVVRDTTTQAGSIFFERQGGSVSMGAVITDPKTHAKSKVLAYSGGKLQMFDPGVDQITVLNAGSNQAEYEGFLTLGFGGSGSDLSKAWSVTDQGPETLQDNGAAVKTEKLDLTSKDPKARSTFSHVTIWVDPTRAVSLKQIFYTPSGDVRTAYYSKIRVNHKVDHKEFEIHRDAHTTVVQH